MNVSQKLYWCAGLVAAALVWNVITASPWGATASAQGPSGVFTIGERLEIRSTGGMAAKECTVTRVANNWLQCQEQPMDWWNTQQMIQVSRKARPDGLENRN